MDGKVALVTGGASGIGAATVTRLVHDGARVVIADIDREKGEHLEKELGGASLFVELDVSDLASWDTAIAQTVAHFGQLHCLMNNAAIALSGTVETIAVDDWHATMDVVLNGAFYGCKTTFPAIRASGGGAILNIASNSIYEGHEQLLAYTSAKSGLVSLSRSIAAYCLNKQIPIRCNTLVPGFVATPMVATVIRRDLGMDPESPEGQAFLAALAPPAAVATVAAFLLSEDAAYINGEEILADGGRTRTVPSMS
ncbi:MAG: SDR family oxidoreductase [Actinobacteria bacterium]|nr:SDR family oxidoreductase [Actinomycetota bacterium]